MGAAPPVTALPRYASALDSTSFRVTCADALVDVRVRQLGGPAVTEQWPELPATIFGSVVIEEADDLAAAAASAYSRILREAHAARRPHFVRIWNYVGSINEPDAGVERYKQFCAGRHDAFRSAGYEDTQLPAASAVGMSGRGLTIYYLASSERGVHIENPRQVSAYLYPPQYGKKSPSFARATLWNETLFVSGTSSVIGHETVHHGDVVAQLEETLTNIEAVIRQAMPGGDLRNVVLAKTYLRNASDHALVAPRLAPLFPANVYLEADICRKDLLIEIEVVAR